MKVSIHPTAIVQEGAQIGDGVEIGPYCIVGGQARLGEGCRLTSHVVVEGRTAIGRENVLHPFAVIGGPPQDSKDKGDDGEVTVGDRNIIREHVTINRGTRRGGGKTRLGSDCYLMAASHVGHDCIVGNHVIMVNSALLGGHVELQDYAYVSGHVGIHQYASVGTHAFIGSTSRIPTDVPPYMLVQGEDHEVICVNAVGLKRHGFDRETINALKEAHRVIWMSGLPLPDAVRTLKRMFNGHYREVDYLVQFLENSSKGKNGRARESQRNLPIPGVL
jgi:UDP-N-acetylglucosamine acyltransferase